MSAAAASATKPETGGLSLDLDHITHRFGGYLAVENVTLNVGGGEMVALLGPSGCGKTTLLRIIAGFTRPSEGKVLVGGQEVDHLPPNQRAVGIVFQNYALFPHMSVTENVAYGLAARGAGKAEQASEAKRLLELVQLAHLADRLPRQLSGGQQQRVALARALAIRPSILLLDEPFAALDKNLRLDMQIEVKRLQRLSGITTIMVTHDQEEALSMADRVAVLSKGKLEQFAPPTEIYDAPGSLFVNTFVGSANVLQGELLGAAQDGVAVRLDIGGDIIARAPLQAIASGSRVSVCLRPEHLRIAAEGSGFPGTVEMALPLGGTVVHEVRGKGGVGVKIAEPRLSGATLRAQGTPVGVVMAAPGLASVFASAS